MQKLVKAWFIDNSDGRAFNHTFVTEERAEEFSKNHGLELYKTESTYEEIKFENMNLIELHDLYWVYTQQGEQQKADEVLKYVKYHWPDQTED